jgi:hypothetical protein
VSEISDLLNQARDSASALVDRHTSPSKKGAALHLYQILADCKRLCERCERHAEDFDEVKRLFAQQPKTGNRRFVEKGSDIYVFICRFVFTDTDRTNAMRYAAALRVAAEMQISGDRLAEHMKENGGVNALYFRRPLDERNVETKCLRLAQQITFSRDEPITLQLTWRTDNAFDVEVLS